LIVEERVEVWLGFGKLIFKSIFKILVVGI
jgi:hypothetical protein